MTFVTEIRKTVTDTTPVYAVVGATDLAVEKIREAGERAAARRAELEAVDIQAEAAKLQAQLTGQVQQAPALALNRTREIAGKAQESYDGLAERGENLVKRIRNQKATKDLLAQAGSTIAHGKGAVTTARKAALDTQRAAKATLTIGRREAAVVAETVVDSVQDEVKTAAATVRKSAAATRTSAERTSTTAKESAEATRTATRSAATGARKTAETASKATTTASDKVGD